jgi:chaperonin GroES
LAGFASSRIAILDHNSLNNNALGAAAAFGHHSCYQNPRPILFPQSIKENVMKVRPLGDRVVVRREEGSEKTAGGILLPDAAKEKPQKGKVLAIGAGRLLKDGTRNGVQVKVGDTVIFTAWAGDEYKDGKGGNILLMREEDILAVVDE